MKRLLASTILAVFVTGCAAAGMDLPPVKDAPPNPNPINAAKGDGTTTLPLIDNLASFLANNEERPNPGNKRPRKTEIVGDTWKPEFDPNSTYHIQVQTTDSSGMRTVQQVLVSSDLPVGRGSCAHQGFQAVPMGSAVAIAPMPGAPVGTKVSCAIEFGGQRAKIVAEATSRMGISELHFAVRKRGRQSFPQGVCSHANYSVNKIVPYGPLGACAIADVSGANTATYVKLPANLGEMPAVKIGDGKNARLARSSVKKLPTGERLVRVQGSHAQIVLQYPNGDVVALTRKGM